MGSTLSALHEPTPDTSNDTSHHRTSTSITHPSVLKIVPSITSTMTYQVQDIHANSPAENLCDLRTGETTMDADSQTPQRLISHSCINEIHKHAARLAALHKGTQQPISPTPNHIHPYIDHIISLDTFPITQLEANPSFYHKYLERSLGQSICLRVWSALTGMERNVWIRPQLKVDASYMDKEANEDLQSQLPQDISHDLNTHHDDSPSMQNPDATKTPPQQTSAWIGLNCRIVNVHEAKNWIWRILSIRPNSEAERLGLQYNDFILGVNGTLFEENGKWPIGRAEKLLVYRWNEDILDELLLQPNQELGCEIVMGESHSSLLFDKWVRMMEEAIDEEHQLLEAGTSKDDESDAQANISPTIPERSGIS